MCPEMGLLGKASSTVETPHSSPGPLRTRVFCWCVVLPTASGGTAACDCWVGRRPCWGHMASTLDLERATPPPPLPHSSCCFHVFVSSLPCAQVAVDASEMIKGAMSEEIARLGGAVKQVRCAPAPLQPLLFHVHLLNIVPSLAHSPSPSHSLLLRNAVTSHSSPKHPPPLTPITSIPSPV